MRRVHQRPGTCDQELLLELWSWHSSYDGRQVTYIQMDYPESRCPKAQVKDERVIGACDIRACSP